MRSYRELHDYLHSLYKDKKLGESVDLEFTPKEYSEFINESHGGLFTNAELTLEAKLKYSGKIINIKVKHD